MSQHGISVQVLVKNATGEGSRVAEHALALWIFVPHGDTSLRILFVAGQTGSTLVHNAGILRLDRTSLDAVALSHGRYDHTGDRAMAGLWHAFGDQVSSAHKERASG